MTTASKNFAKHVKARRIELGLSPADAAELVGVSRQAWAAWERGTVPYDRNWAAIERTLKWKRGSVESVRDGGEPGAIEGEGASGVPPIPEGMRIDPDDWALMTADERARVVRLLTNLRRRREQSRGA